MIFPILLVVIPAILIVLAARWAKTDDEDIIRKIVTSVVQVMCLLVMAMGVAWFANRSANRPASNNEAAVTPTFPARATPVRGSYVPRAGAPSPQYLPAPNYPPTGAANQPYSAPDPSGGQNADPSAGQSVDPNGTQNPDQAGSIPAQPQPDQNPTQPAAPDSSNPNVGNPPGADSGPSGSSSPSSG